MSILQAKGLALAGKTVMSGIQPTGVFHIGNLLGAVKSWVDFNQRAPESTEIIYMIADLHALTVPKDPSKLREYRWNALASMLAAGIEPKRCHLYFQSQVPAHAELHWILSSCSSMGYLSRMVQWKSKGGIKESDSITNMNNAAIANLNLALFSYPTLQAADILIHNADYVPVGDDQSQHLELSRHIAQSFNHRFGETFKLPGTVLTPYKKILSLRDPTKKMSKSDADANATIQMTDDSATIYKKFKRAVTDSVQGPITFDPTNRPGVANLVLIGSGIDECTPEEYIQTHKLNTHAQLKEAVSSTVDKYLRPIRDRYKTVVEDKSYLEQIAAESAHKVQDKTAVQLERVKAAVGF